MFRKSLIPLAVFVAIITLMAIGLNRDPSKIPSPFIGEQAPTFKLPNLLSQREFIANKDMLGKVWLFNVWASWCAACRDEHPLLIRLSQLDVVDIVGLNYKDKSTDADRWLEQLGNPYTVIAFDQSGNVGIDYGVYGVPETFVIDKQGTIRLKHIGPLTSADIQREIMPMIYKLQEEKI